MNQPDRPETLTPADLQDWQRDYLRRSAERYDALRANQRQPLPLFPQSSGVVQGAKAPAAVVDEVARHRAVTVGDNSCLACGERFNARQAVTAGSVPHEGALSICHRCGAVALFVLRGGVLKLRHPSREEDAELAQSVEVKAARSAILVQRAIANHPQGKKS